ncbi:uncharacterized protein F4807DRAFT_348756 [Annulohypoxylon truncatum]|uniref:uncharacterized protein n=1 Tax=Annulohypoxylon truncatum TaxID=327061 RepID=UPI0020088F88|nr:uncharacterized protein F4807DRAFT_348756 [Annulohypoxylon truncatum]KAI1212761.1 hypothetical protein F4807DRAFT_348756 [Annulohypoxylon truncatum]
MDPPTEEWKKWRDEWTSRLTVPTMALSRFIPEIPRIPLLACVESAYTEAAFREFYEDCIRPALRIPFHAIQGVRMTAENEMRIQLRTLRRAVVDFEKEPDTDISRFNIASGVRRRELKQDWYGYDHIAHFMRRVYQFGLRVNLISEHILDPDKRIMMVLGAFMIYMRIQSMDEYPELQHPLDASGNSLSITGSPDHWFDRFNSHEADTYDQLEARLKIIADKIEDSFGKGIRDRYHEHAHFFRIFVEYAKLKFRQLIYPEASEWWWYCEKGFALPYLIPTLGTGT